MTVTASVFPAWGKPHADAALAGSDCSPLREHQSRLSAHAHRFLFRERSRPSRPPVFFLSGTCGEKQRGRGFQRSGWKRAHAGSDPACLVFTTQRAFSRPFYPTWPASLRKRERSGLVWGKWRWAGRWQHVTGSFRCWGAVGLSDWPRPLRFARAQRRQSRDGCRTFPCSSPKRLKSWVWSGLHQRSPLAAVWMSGFCRGAVRPLNNDHRRSSLKYMTSSRDLGALLTLPASVLRSSALTTVDGAEEKGYERMPQLDESVAAHLCPPTAIGWKAKASHPSKPCRTTSALAGRSYASAGQAASALHSMAVLQVYQAKLLSAIDESEPDPATLRELRSATDLALRATKDYRPSHRKVYGQPGSARAPPVAHADGDQGCGQGLLPWCSNFPQRPLWTCGWKDSLSASQKHRRHHRLCDTPAKRSSPADDQSRPRTAPTQQSAKPAPAVYAPQPARTQQPRGHSRSARRHPPPTRQGPRHQDSVGPCAPGVLLICRTGRGEGRVPPRPDRPPKGLSWETSWHPVLFRVQRELCLLLQGPYKRPCNCPLW